LRHLAGIPKMAVLTIQAVNITFQCYTASKLKILWVACMLTEDDFLVRRIPFHEQRW
jgi:hypothetical protein